MKKTLIFTEQCMNKDLAALRSEHLVETDWLAAHLTDPYLAIVDMRGYVRTTNHPDGYQTADYLGARDEYLASHIPGAVYLDWTADIVDTDDPIPAQVAGPEKTSSALGRAGIGNDALVIAYDNHAAMQFATRLWWVLRYYGYDSVRVLNGGWAKWFAENRPTTNGEQTNKPKTFVNKIRPELRVTADEILACLGQPGTTLVDARDEGQYTGRLRRGLHGGHIPGAINLSREALISEAGTFKSPDDLQKQIAQAGLTPEKRTIAYCNGGVAATTILFALSMLGNENGANYDGSWNEWGNRAHLPVDTK
jgi:thiosulfate/3-mercaptopyruvate sulfurtransferase